MLGLYPSLEAAVDRVVTADRSSTPRADSAARYATLYDLFVDVRTPMESVWVRRAAAYCDHPDVESESD